MKTVQLKKHKTGDWLYLSKKINLKNPLVLVFGSRFMLEDETIYSEPQAGLTGLWQVSGRTTLSFKEMIHLDVQYAQQRSLKLDIEILLRTVPTILSRDGAW